MSNEQLEAMGKACAEAYKEEQALAKSTAETILQQLGGKRFILMTGAKNLGYRSGDGFGLGALTLDIGKAGGFNDSGINRVIIHLEGNDTYTMRFYKAKRGMVRKGKWYDGSITLLKEHKEVYCDMLTDIFYKETNLICYMGQI